ncbi:MAG: glycosyltransferase family 39 protein, partial [Candidatus Omnitrophica bacterium]|nr:glycosyltransferase family 39 protein [Candidatus Omnitrophota bacterium]
MNKGRYYYMPLGIAVSLACFLRLYQIGQKSFWYDEACSISFACRKLSLGIFSDHYIMRPLYFIFLNIWSHLFGINEVITRLPSAIFGVLAVVAVYFLAKELFDHKTANIASFLMAISYYQIAWSQEVRYYSLFLLMCLLSNLYYFRLIKLSDGKHCFAYLLTTIMAIFTLPIAIIMPVIQLGHYCIFARGAIGRKIWLVNIFIAAVILILAGLGSAVKGNILEDMLLAPSFKLSIQNILKLLNTFNNGGGNIAQGALSNYMGQNAIYYLFLNIIFYFFYLGGIFKEIGAKSTFKNILFLLAWQWIPFLGLSFLYFFGFHLLVMRYFIFTMPAYYIIVARGITHLKSRLLIIPLLICILLLNIPSLAAYYHPKNYYSWREVSGNVKEKGSKDDIIILSPLQTLAPFCLYYLNDLKDFGSIGNGYNGKGIKINGNWQDRFYDKGIIIWG